jgi:hypothetical protein
MSTATIPFIFRSGFLPGITFAPGSPYNYIDLNATDGDQGLREALRIWWATEQIIFTPTGTATAGPDTATFEHVYQAPDAQDTTDPDFAAVEQQGAICASSVDIGSTTTKQPALRGIAGGSYPFAFSACLFEQGFSSDPPQRNENGLFDFKIHYTGSQWRLYYAFRFFVSIVDETTSPPEVYLAQIGITNTNLPLDPPVLDGTVRATGTVSLFGYTLDWHAGYYLFASSGPTPTVSGIGLSASSTEWSF